MSARTIRVELISKGVRLVGRRVRGHQMSLPAFLPADASALSRGQNYVLVGSGGSGKTYAIQSILDTLPLGKTVVYDCMSNMTTAWEGLASAEVHEEPAQFILDDCLGVSTPMNPGLSLGVNTLGKGPLEHVDADIERLLTEQQELVKRGVHRQLYIVIDHSFHLLRMAQTHAWIAAPIRHLQLPVWPTALVRAMSVGRYIGVTVFATVRSIHNIPDNVINNIDHLLLFSQPIHATSTVDDMIARFGRDVFPPKKELCTIVQTACKWAHDALVVSPTLSLPQGVPALSTYHATNAATEEWRQHNRVAQFRDELLWYYHNIHAT